METSQCLGRGWKESLAAVFASARKELLICSPYITQEGTQLVEQHISGDFKQTGHCSVLTNLTPINIIQGATDPRALQRLSSGIPNFTLRHLPRLHAKVYIADEKLAIVTSANLTRGGIEANYEYGIRFDNYKTVAQIRSDIVGYGELGAPLSYEDLTSYAEIAEQVRRAFQKQQRTIARSAKSNFEQLLRQAENDLIAIRISGASRTQVFERTIEYLLARHGPMQTKEIHLRIVAIHPDLCDATIDRVIHGRHFGKEWKHAVRSAQAHLKARGRIRLSGKQWIAC